MIETAGLLFIALLMVFWFHNQKQQKIRVLMYHKVDTERSDLLTVTNEQLDRQLQYLKRNGYKTLSINSLTHQYIPPKSVLLTFDDAYLNNLSVAYPILKKHDVPATIFVPTAYVGGHSDWDAEDEPLMSVSMLQNLDKEIFSLGLHSHQHQNYGKMLIDEIRGDLLENIGFFKENAIDFVPAFAYPYGGRPASERNLSELYKLFEELGIKLAFRIGNRLNGWPLKNHYQIERIDVRGTDSFEAFKRKIKWGKIL